MGQDATGNPPSQQEQMAAYLGGDMGKVWKNMFAMVLLKGGYKPGPNGQIIGPNGKPVSPDDVPADSGSGAGNVDGGGQKSAQVGAKASAMSKRRRVAQPARTGTLLSGSGSLGADQYNTLLGAP